MPVQYTMPPDTRAVGTADPPADVNALIRAANAMGATLNVLSASFSGGADPTGAADSTAAIQAALNAATAGQRVTLPGGTYKTTAPLALPAGVTLAGAGGWPSPGQGLGSVLVPAASFTGSAVLTMTVTSGTAVGAHIRDLSIDGTSAPASVAGITGTGNVTNAAITNVFIYKPTGIGIDATLSNASGSPVGWHVMHTRVDTGSVQGIACGTMTDAQWYDVHVINCGSHGWSIAGAPSNSRFVSCRAEYANAGGDGFHLVSSWNTGGGAGGVVFSGCSTDGNDGHGMNITATGTAPVILSGCMFRRDGHNGTSGGGNYAGLNISSATVPVIIDGITVYPGVATGGANSPQNGVAVAGSSTVVVRSGYIQGATNALVVGTGNSYLHIGPDVVQATGTTASPALVTTAQPAPVLYHAASAATAETVPRSSVTTAVTALTSGTLTCRGIVMLAGTLVSNITTYVNTTGKTGGAHGWVVLMDTTMKVLGVSADQTDAATTWGSTSAAQTIAIATPFTISRTGLYYVGIMVAATQMPTLSGSGAVTGGIAGTAPILCGTSSTAQTTPPSVGATMTALSSNGGFNFYAYTS